MIRENVVLFLKGVLMGIANIIPGLSGGTVAFITGIYERLIHALKSFNKANLSLLFQGRWLQFSQCVDLSFLIILFSGVFVSLIFLAHIMEWLLEDFEVLTLAFFFGLIVASIFAIFRQLKKLNITVLLMIILGTCVAIIIAFLPPSQEQSNAFYLFLCGVVAICSMILPGLSGAYILILMGNYLLVLRAVQTFDLAVLVPLGCGVVLGLILFSNVLSYLYGRFKDQTVGLLMGFVVGSLLIIWPWKRTIMQSFGGKEKAIAYEWFPPTFDSTEFYFALALFLLGFILVLSMDKFSSKETS